MTKKDYVAIAEVIIEFAAEHPEIPKMPIAELVNKFTMMLIETNAAFDADRFQTYVYDAISSSNLHWEWDMQHTVIVTHKVVQPKSTQRPVARPHLAYFNRLERDRLREETRRQKLGQPPLSKPSPYETFVTITRHGRG